MKIDYKKATYKTALASLAAFAFFSYNSKPATAFGTKTNPPAIENPVTENLETRTQNTGTSHIPQDTSQNILDKNSILNPEVIPKDEFSQQKKEFHKKKYDDLAAKTQTAEIRQNNPYLIKKELEIILYQTTAENEKFDEIARKYGGCQKQKKQPKKESPKKCYGDQIYAMNSESNLNAIDETGEKTTVGTGGNEKASGKSAKKGYLLVIPVDKNMQFMKINYENPNIAGEINSLIKEKIKKEEYICMRSDDESCSASSKYIMMQRVFGGQAAQDVNIAGAACESCISTLDHLGKEIDQARDAVLVQNQMSQEKQKILNGQQNMMAAGGPGETIRKAERGNASIAPAPIAPATRAISITPEDIFMTSNSQSANTPSNKTPQTNGTSIKAGATDSSKKEKQHDQHQNPSGWNLSIFTDIGRADGIGASIEKTNQENTDSLGFYAKLNFEDSKKESYNTWRETELMPSGLGYSKKTTDEWMKERFEYGPEAGVIYRHNFSSKISAGISAGGIKQERTTEQTQQITVCLEVNEECINGTPVKSAPQTVKKKEKDELLTSTISIDYNLTDNISIGAAYNKRFNDDSDRDSEVQARIRLRMR